MPQGTITKIVAHLRVTNESIKSQLRVPQEPFLPFKEEIVEYKAFGTWGDQSYPISIHLTAFPGCEAIPLCGNRMKITIEREVIQ